MRCILEPTSIPVDHLSKAQPQDHANLIVRGGFVAIVCLMLIVGVAGIQHLQSLYHGMTTIVEVNNKKIQLAYIMQDAIRQRSTLLHYMYAVDDQFERDEKLLEYHQTAGAYRVSRDKLLSMSMTTTENTLYKQLTIATKTAQPDSDYVASLLSDEANQEIIKDALEARDIISEPVLDYLDELIDLQKKYGEKTLNQARDEYDVTLLVVVSLGLFAIVLAFIIAHFVSKFVDIEKGQLLEKNRELKLATKSKSDFLARMGHELRTPLNAIFGYSELIEEEASELELTRTVADLNKIQGASKHLLTLIDGIFDISKIVSGDTIVNAEKISIKRLVDYVAATIKPLADKKNNLIAVSIENDNISITSDIVKLRQTLFNLLSNACKFTDHGNIVISAETVQIESVEWIKICVKDNGIGMHEGQLNNLFDDYSQADNSIPQYYGGTGLGLSISRKICELLGGKLSVRSEIDQGSEFTVLLPCDKTHADSLKLQKIQAA